MSDWKLFLECSQGHRFGIEAICPECEQVVAEHLHTEPPEPIQLSRWKLWRETRRLRKKADRFDWTA